MLQIKDKKWGNIALTKVKKVPCKIAIGFIMVYRIIISPLFPPCCRFEPTCSQYGLEAFRKYGFYKGLTLTVKRIIRCRPGGDHGYDPVP